MAAVIVWGEQVLLAQHPVKGLLGGLWEFPAAEVEVVSAPDLAAAMQVAYGLTITPVAFLEQIRHAYTHFTLTEFVWRCDLHGTIENETLKWISRTELQAYPMGKVDRRIASRLK
jgi:A/G-specific adenine glycosylase